MKKISILVLMMFVTVIGFADVITKTYIIDNPNVVYNGDYQSVEFNGAMLTGIAGSPSLPYFAVSLLVPPGEVATSIKFTGEDEVTIDGRFKLYPYQSSKPLSQPDNSIFLFNESVYKLNKAYPDNQMGGLSTNYLNGHGIAMSTFTPVVYYPAQGKISYYKKVTITITTAADKKSEHALKNLSSSVIANQNLMNIIQNPELSDLYNNYRNKSANTYGLLIITPDEFVDGFESLTDIYYSRGIKSEIFSTEYISTNISGQDLQEKIRNLIIAEYQESSIDFVILGGDIEHVPYRGFSCDVVSGGGYSSDDIPADLYYSALDGNWNTDGDNRWGEPDEDDLLPEIALGRYPFSHAYELERIIHKSINYQNNPVLGELVTPLLAAEHLYSDPETWGRDYLDLLIGERDDNGYTTIGIPNTYQIDSLYEHTSSWNGSDLMNEINEGKQFVHHVGHASPSFVAHLYSSDITNANFSGANGIDHNFTIMQTHGCDCGSFDYNDCILEKMVTIDNFAVSVIGNSRFGWFNEGQNEGPAAHLHREMVDAMYHEKMRFLGNAFTESKIQTAPWVEAPGQHEEGALRWNFYDINILGDPALSVWTNEPIDIEVTYPQTLAVGTPNTNINVTSLGLPMENFVCSIIKDGLLHATGTTNDAGNVTLTFDPLINEVGDALLITVGQNCLPDTNYIEFVPSGGAYVIYNSSQIADPDGNNNQLADFGESILLTVAVSNLGEEDAQNVVATLSTADEFISITDDNEDYGLVTASHIVEKIDAFAYDIASNIPDQHSVVFNLQCESNGDIWNSQFETVVNAPLPKIGEMLVDDSETGNNNSKLDPGESVTISIEASNFGHSDCSFSEIALTSASPYLIITPSIVNLEMLLVGETKLAEFNVVVDQETPIGTAVEFDYELNLCDYIDQKTIINSVGLLIEDFETGDFSMFDWQMGGSAAWNITDDEPFNGQYCSQSASIGDEATSELIIELYVLHNDDISFARKVSSEENYDYLRFYVDDVKVEEWSGTQSWEIETFNLTPGEHTLRWSYEKDANTIAGSDCAWIDDVVFPASSLIMGTEELEIANDFNIFPNPGSGHYTVSSTSKNDNHKVRVYNTLGSIVATPVTNFAFGKSNIDLSNLLPGIYFVEISNGATSVIKKIIQK